MDKKTARAYVREKKRQMTENEIKKKSRRIQARLFEETCFLEADVIYCYVSYDQEVMTRTLITEALESGKRVAVPKVMGKEMEFIYLHSLEELVSGYRGIDEPVGTEIAREEKALMILPGLAFDGHGNRVGYGGGFYDRYLNKWKDTCFARLAVAFDFQVVDHLEMEPCDQKVDLILTESRRIVTA